MPREKAPAASGTGSDERDQSKNGETLPKDFMRTGVLVAGILAVALIATVLRALVPSVAVAIMWMLACLAAGTAVGFLFGIPKILQSNGPDAGAGGQATTPEAHRSYRQQVNTNLTEISDWLTKIIVGVSLINLTKLPPYLDRTAETLARGLGPDRTSNLAFAYGLIICSSVVGFLFGYLWTRLFLAGAFSRADQEASAELRSVQQVLASTQSAVASLETTQDLLKDSVFRSSESTQPSTEAAAAAAAAPSPEEDAQLEELRRMAVEYMNISAPDYADRVRLKDLAANRMAAYVLQQKINRDSLFRFVRANPDEGLVLALATVINTAPMPRDFDRLMQVASGVKRKHVRYRVLVALSKLIRMGMDDPRRADQVKALLAEYEDGADGSLRRLIQDVSTAASATRTRMPFAS